MTRDLPREVSLARPDLDVADLAARFRPFEALHDGLDICSPVSAGDLDRISDLLDIQVGHRVLDVACGHGAMLQRLANRSAYATGIDLSPWAAARAAGLLSRHGLTAAVVLGDAAGLPADPAWDRIVCLGAAWIFHGFEGTCRALSRRLDQPGRLAIGDLRERRPAPTGRVLSGDQQIRIIEDLGGRVLDVIVAADEAWSAYATAVLAAADRHHRRHRGDPLADQRMVARQWVADLERDRSLLDFAVVVAEFNP